MFSKIFTLLVPFLLYNNWPYGYIVVFFYIEESINTTLQRFVDFLTCNIFYDFLKIISRILIQFILFKKLANCCVSVFCILFSYFKAF